MSDSLKKDWRELCVAVDEGKRLNEVDFAGSRTD